MFFYFTVFFNLFIFYTELGKWACTRDNCCNIFTQFLGKKVVDCHITAVELNSTTKAFSYPTVSQKH